MIKKDPASQAGLVEELTEIQINDTVPTYQSLIIVMIISYPYRKHYQWEFQVSVLANWHPWPHFGPWSSQAGLQNGNRDGRSRCLPADHPGYYSDLIIGSSRYLDIIHLYFPPGLPLFRTAYTYFNITQSPLIPAFIKGSVSKVTFAIFEMRVHVLSKVTRGWGQVIKLDGSLYSIDPDEPGDKSFNYTWFCRRSPFQVLQS